MNEQDLMDLQEIKELEQMATIREKQGISSFEGEHEEFIKDSQDLIDQALGGGGKRYDIPFSSTTEELNNVSLDLDEEDRPMAPITSTDFLSISQIPNTSSLQVDLLLPEYELKEGQYQGGRTKYTIIFDIEVIQRIHSVFGNFTDIVAFTDGSSIKNPGRVSAASHYYRADVQLPSSASQET